MFSQRCLPAGNMKNFFLFRMVKVRYMIHLYCLYPVYIAPNVNDSAERNN